MNQKIKFRSGKLCEKKFEKGEGEDGKMYKYASTLVLGPAVKETTASMIMIMMS